MSKNERRRPTLVTPQIGMNIRAAKTNGFDDDNDFAGPRLGIADRLKFDFARFGIDKGSHDQGL
jgi:hypothetical protein